MPFPVGLCGSKFNTFLQGVLAGLRHFFADLKGVFLFECLFFSVLSHFRCGLFPLLQKGISHVVTRRFEILRNLVLLRWFQRFAFPDDAVITHHHHIRSKLRELAVSVQNAFLSQQVDRTRFNATVLLFKVSPGNLVNCLVAQIFDSGVGRKHAFIRH